MKSAKQMFEKLGYEFKEIFYNNESNYAYEYSCGGKRFIFQDIDEKGIVIDSVKYISWDELQAVIQQINELGWFGEKQETNLEHYFEDLLNVEVSYGFKDGKIRHCYTMDCDGCVFNQGNCNKERFMWLASPYEKPRCRLSRFEFDLLDIYKKCGMQKCITNYSTLLELNEKGYFKEVDLEAPIGEILENCEIKGE